MLKKILLFTILFSNSYTSFSYEFYDDEFKSSIEDFRYYNYYSIDNMDFVVQAPLKTKANWDIHNESCEEAALFLAHYNTNNLKFDINFADKEFLKMDFYQENYMGIIKDKKHNVNTDLVYLRDISIEKLHELVKGFYDYTDDNSHIINKPSIETLKYLISNDYILVTPSNTKTLGNPNFNQATDSYHVIDLVGYNSSEFITLDPGTSRGAFYKYPYENIIKGIRENGDKILVLEGEINSNNVDFANINYLVKNNHLLEKVLAKIEIILNKNPQKKEVILDKILAKIEYQIDNSKNNQSKKLFTQLGSKLDEKLKFIKGEKKTISYYR
ncbi:MAG: hypothetical protein PHS49_04270 [Candidatus Gracilibacteria bacterium]|nr:hypothetical protein [Candidatus Gracilibacteria bacterium]